jgi:hypothetical protein
VDLNEEHLNALAEQGIDPDRLDYAGTEIEVSEQLPIENSSRSRLA